MQSQSNSARRPAKPDLDRVRSFVEPVLVAHGVDLVDVEWTGGPAGTILRVTIERLEAGSADAPAVDAGVSLEDCADISRDLSAVLDVEDLIPQRYLLEVSSPGLERVLRHRADFQRFAGKLARVKLARPTADGQRVLRGTIEKVEGASPEGACALRVDGKRIEFPYADVREANLVFELAPTPKRGGAPKPGAAKGPGAQKGQGDTRRTEPTKAAKGSGLA